MSLFIFPAHIFNPSSVNALPFSRVISGGESISGFEEVIATDGGGRWIIQMDGIELNTPEKERAWSAWVGYLQGGATTFLVPLVSIDSAPRPETGGVPDPVPPLSYDAEHFPTSVAYDPPYIVAELGADASLRDTSIFIDITTGSALEGGEKFSIGYYAYRVVMDLGGGEYQIDPPLRQDVTAGYPIVFDWPMVRCSLDPQFSLTDELFLGKFGTRSIRFVERIEANPVLPTAPIAAPPFASLDADGWQSDSDDPASIVGQQFQANRPGYTTAAATTTYTVDLSIPTRVRQAYPNEASLTARKAALSRYLYAGDTFGGGVVNNSAVVSPKPNGRWMMPRQQMVGDALDVSVEAFHVDARLGQQVACVQVEIYDAATNTLQDTITIGAPSVSAICTDAHPVHCYEQLGYDISALGDDLYYLVAKIYPWFGGAASVRSSEDGDARRDFDRVYFTKNTSRFNSPPLAYVNTATGNDGTGVWSTTAATAKASPFATERGALDAIDGDATTGSIADGCIVYFEDGTHTLQGAITTSATPQNSASLRYKRSPDSASRAACILQFGSSQFDPNLGINTARNASTLDTGIPWAVLTFEDVTLDRVGTSNFGRSATGTASNAMLYQFVDVTLDNNAQTARWLDSNSVTGGIFGMEFITTAGNNALLGGGSSVEYILQRGITCADLQGGGWDGFSMAGCDIGNAGTATFENNTWGSIVSSSRFHTMSNAWMQENWSSATVVDRIHWLNVEAEYVSTSTTNPVSSMAGTSGSTRGMTVHHCSFIGAQNAFRFNVGYDNQNNTASNEQTHELLSLVGVVCAQINIKGDIYRSDANGADGNFAAVHGVDWEGLYSLYAANSVSQEHPYYPGLNGDLGTSATLIQDSEASLFVNHQAVTAPAGTLTAGTGGGDYTPATGSPLEAMVTERLVCSIDLAGNARVLPAPAGAYDQAGS